MWEVAGGLLRQMEEVDSPAEKLKLLSSAVVSLCSAFALAYPGKDKKATTDDFVPSLILVLLRNAKLSCPTAQFKYLEHFANMSEGSSGSYQD